VSTPNQWRKGHHLPVLSSRPDLFYGRMEVDVSSTAFQEGKQFRISYEYTEVGSTPLVLRFSSPVDFLLQGQDLTSDLVGVRYRVFRAAQGTPGGTFGTQVQITRSNGTSDAKPLNPLVTIFTGGTFTPTAGQVAQETIRIRTPSGSKKSLSVSGEAGDERGIPAGDHYIILQSIDANNLASGVLNLEWEEVRPTE